MCIDTDYTLEMIKSLKHKGLKKLYQTGSKQGVKPEHAARLRLILARLGASSDPKDMNLPGLGLHPLKGSRKNFWSVSVSDNWRVIFRFKNGNATDVDYLDYH
jgi:proteic killer suppression protein